MKYLRSLLPALLMMASTATLAADVGLSISIGQPGFYGQLDIGRFGPPPVIYPEPVIIERGLVVREPLYLRVPPGQARKWKVYCARYEACGRPVYFVRDDWYNRVYVPRYREYYRDGRWDDRWQGRWDDRYDRRQDRRDDRYDRRQDRRDDRHDRREDRRDDRRDKDRD